MLSKNELKYYAKMASNSFVDDPLYIAIIKNKVSEIKIFYTYSIDKCY